MSLPPSTGSRLELELGKDMAVATGTAEAGIRRTHRLARRAAITAARTVA